MGIEIGTGSSDITAFTPGVGMMGFVTEGNVVAAIESPLSARAFVVRDPASGRKLAFAVAEIWSVTMAVKQGVVERLAAQYPELGYSEQNVMLAATHTHSAPGGYSHSFFYNASVPGFVPAVYEAIVAGLVAAIVEADRAARPGVAKLAAGEFAPEVPVAFNRAITAHNANRDVTPVPRDARHLAVDREMTLLRFETADGTPIGAFNWFAVHATSVGNDNTRVTPDNKGYAAQFVEAAQREAGRARFVAGFAQGAAGDVSPNFRRYPGKVGLRGAYEDDFESARFSGRLQADQAEALFAQAATAPPVAEAIDAALMWVDFSRVEIPPDLADGEPGHHTASASIGARMLQGTAEGTGIPPLAGALVRQISRAACARERLAARFLPEAARREVLAKYRAQGNKVIFLDMGQGRMLGTKGLALSVLPGWADQTVRHIKAMHKRRLTGEGPWTPNVLPVQLFILGELAIAGVPGELTTQSGRRLRRVLLDTLAAHGVTRVVTCCYANAYAGYVTTPEEYDLQHYEGASTHFGRWTQPAYMATFRELAVELLKPAAERRLDRGAEPIRLTREQLDRMMHEAPAGA